MKTASKRKQLSIRHKSSPLRKLGKRAIVKVEKPTVAEAIEKVLLQGNLQPLTVEQRLEYYKAVCKSLGLNPLTRPFDYLVLDGKTVLYARKDCTEQLRKIHGIAITESSGNHEEGLYVVRVKAQDKTGRTDTGTGAVDLTNLKGKPLANAIMIAETKAKRRATLSLAGLGFLDESEIEGLEEYGTITPGGRVMYENQKSLPGPTQEQVDAHDADNVHLKAYEERAKAQEHPTEMVRSLFYTHDAKHNLYAITGSDSLKTENKDLLGPLWSGMTKEILATPEQLGKLLSKLEDRKVPIRELREPGE